MSSSSSDNNNTSSTGLDVAEMKDGGGSSNGAEFPLSESREDVSFRDAKNERDDASQSQQPQQHEPATTTTRKKAPTTAVGSQQNQQQHTAAATTTHNRKGKKSQQDSQQTQQQQQQSGRYYQSMQPPPQGHYAPPPPGGGMPRGPAGPPYGGPPYPYGGGNGPFPPHYHPAAAHHAHAAAHQHPHHHPGQQQIPPHMMPPHFNAGAGGGHYPPNTHSMGNPPPPRGGNNGGAGNGPYSSHYGHPYPTGAGMGGPSGYSSGMPPSYPTSNNNSNNNNMPCSDSASISSKGSKSSKKRTIDGVHESSSTTISGPQAYTFRRCDSNSSTTSTVTAGNNTTIDTHGTEESHNDNKNHSFAQRGDGAATGYDEHSSHYANNHNSGNNHSSSNNEGRPMRTRYHRRDYSADGSTTSSLSAGFSLASYDGPKDHMSTEPPIRRSSPKRMKGADGEALSVDTNIRPPSVASREADQSTRFEQLSIGVKEEPASTKSESSNESGNPNLFLSLSTSPINATADVDATPISKNTSKNAQEENNDKGKPTGIFKKKDDSLPNIEVSTSDVGGQSESPTPPPVHGELGDSDMIGDDHSTLNRHLRGQSFTPVNHLSSDNGNDQAASHGGDGQFSIAPQLSWSIAGDTPSLGDLAEWEEESKSKNAAADQKMIKPSSTTDSHESRNMSISPHDFHLWKEEHELSDQPIGGATTPLPAFFESRGGEGGGAGETSTNYETRTKKHHPGEDPRPNFVSSSSRHPGQNGGGGGGGRPMPHHWSKHDHMGHAMPPTPLYSSAEYRDDTFPLVRSPYGADRRDQIDGAGAFPFFPHPGAGMHSNDRVRNLRGRMPPNAHFPPMLHIPPPMSAQLPMTSPMALPNKAGLWSPHHGGLPPLNSPHHLTSPMNSMAHTKRKCVPLKPPIPSKFQGDVEKVKNIPVPEFTSLVNFPSHMSQKQAVNLPEGMRCCVMCGNACPSSNGGKNKNKKKSGEAGGLAQRSNNGQDMMGGDKSSGYAQIPTQNKGLCTLCDVNVWVVVASGLEIKWCKGCKNFRQWFTFGDKGLATKCLRCRERQREKYALQKEEKERARNQAAALKSKS